MPVYKPKQHLKQHTGLNYLTNFEMTHLKFSLTSQYHKTNKFAYRVQKWKKLSNCGLVSSNNQLMQAHLN